MCRDYIHVNVEMCIHVKGRALHSCEDREMQSACEYTEAKRVLHSCEFKDISCEFKEISCREMRSACEYRG